MYLWSYPMDFMAEIQTTNVILLHDGARGYMKREMQFTFFLKNSVAVEETTGEVKYELFRIDKICYKRS